MRNLLHRGLARREEGGSRERTVSTIGTAGVTIPTDGGLVMPAEAAAIEAAARVTAETGTRIVVAAVKATVVAAYLVIDMARVLRVIAIVRGVVMRQRIGAQEEQARGIGLRSSEAAVALLTRKRFVTHRGEHQQYQQTRTNDDHRQQKQDFHKTSPGVMKPD